MLDCKQTLVNSGKDYPSIDALIYTFKEYTNGDHARQKADINILSALFGSFVLRDIAQLVWHKDNVTNKVSGWLDLSTIYSIEDEVDCIDGKLDISRWIEHIDNESKLNSDEKKITFENLWNTIFLLAHNQLVDKHRMRFLPYLRLNYIDGPEKEI